VSWLRTNPESGVPALLTANTLPARVPGCLGAQIPGWAKAPVILGLILTAAMQGRTWFRFGICVFALAHAGLHGA